MAILLVDDHSQPLSVNCCMFDVENEAGDGEEAQAVQREIFSIPSILASISISGLN